jgi:hypothetical protein
MRFSSDAKGWSPWVGTWLAMLALATATQAELFPCHCQNEHTGSPPYNHPSFGYYQTQWRAWYGSGPGPKVSVGPIYESAPPPIVSTSHVPPAGSPNGHSTFVPASYEPRQPSPDTLNLAPPEHPALLNLGVGAPRGYPGLNYRNSP